MTALAQTPPREAQANCPEFVSGTPTPVAAESRSYSFTPPQAAVACGNISCPRSPSGGYRVITYDRRGFGRSTVDPAGPQPGTGADDLLALATHLGLDRFHLVGTAAGGIVALDFAAVVSTAAAKPRRSQQHWRGAGRGVSRAGATAEACLSSMRFLLTFASWGRRTGPPIRVAQRAGSNSSAKAGRKGHQPPRRRFVTG